MHLNARHEPSLAPAATAAAAPSICIVGPLPPPSGGMANQCEQLVRLLARDGVKVELVRNNAPYRPRWAGGIPVLRALCRLLPYLVRLWQAAGRAEVMHILANSGWAWHLFAAPAVWIARRRGTKVIVNYRGGNADAFFTRALKPGAELRQDPATKQGAIARVAEQLGMHPETLRNWVRQAEIDGGVRPGTTSAEAERIAKLEQEVRELRRANHILKT